MMKTCMSATILCFINKVQMINDQILFQLASITIYSFHLKYDHKLKHQYQILANLHIHTKVPIYTHTQKFHWRDLSPCNAKV